MSKTIAGALVGGALGAFGKKPKIPQLPRLDVGTVQREATTANLAALPGLEQLTTAVNRFNVDEISRMLKQALPGFTGALRRTTETAGALGRGEIPEDVSRAVQSSAAARSLGGGFAGSGFSRNLVARDLGLTSLQLTGEGQNRLMGLGGFAGQMFPRFDFTTAFITPQQKLAFDFQQNLAQWQRDLLAAQVKAAPDPATAELGEAMDNFFETWKNIGVGMLGGGGGFGGMGGGTSAPRGNQSPSWMG